MFSMFDITNKGYITIDQYKEGMLRTTCFSFSINITSQKHYQIWDTHKQIPHIFQKIIELLWNYF